jgi:preprotein translocase subunit SecE
VSEDSGGRRRESGDGDEVRPTTAAGRRRRESAASDGGSGATAATSSTAATATGLKGSPTPSRDGRPSTTQGSAVARLRRFLREVVAELRKVHWPTRRQIVVYTIVVLVFVAFMVSFVSLLDAAFAKVVFAIFG